MYYIKPQSIDGFFSADVRFIKVSPTSGCNIEATKEEAQGIVVNGTPYSISVDNPIPDIETATCAFIIEWDEEVQAKYDVMMCEKAAKEKVEQTKVTLADYLETHPMSWIDSKQYSVTQEKQSLLMGSIAAYQIEAQMNPEAELTWNATGEECTPWTIENLSALAVAIKNYVKPYVSYQQSKEVEIGKCKTAQEVYDVVVDYDEVAK